MTNQMHRYDLELDEDTHWAFVKLGAELKMHQEDYAEKILKEHAKHELGKQIKN